ncbi:hypothetical protein RJ641_030380 [Dillenia turbinata]|uniref:Bifunctional inhibitor/plant lipid transfer protein/seed storage helical domain-containing protein n=1 Tax=Dillenia turbinata TaxID=194707 RepID=A0AAN8W022_9MAGN
MVMETCKLLIFVLMAVALMMPNTRGEPGPVTIAGGSWPRPKPEPEPEPWSSSRPLCLSQFALVNHACSALPVTPIDPPDPQGFELESDQHEHHNNRDDHEGRHRHQHGHHSHSHSHRHRHHTSPIEDDCCKWLKEVDSICVCELLVHLPPFLTMPAHAYSITVDDTCRVTFTCSQRT